MGHDGIWWDTPLAWYHIVGIAKDNLLAIWIGRSSNWSVLLVGWLALLPVREDYGGKCGSSLSNICFSFLLFRCFLFFCGVLLLAGPSSLLLQNFCSIHPVAWWEHVVISVVISASCPSVFSYLRLAHDLGWRLFLCCPFCWVRGFFSITDLCHCISPFVATSPSSQNDSAPWSSDKDIC